MASQILNYLGASHAEYIHARGKLATGKIIELLALEPNEKILEIGFGTGATLVQLAARYKGCSFSGYDLSETMYNKASKRIQFCELTDSIEVTLLSEKNKFPANDNAFDKVYAESIIAIQEGEDFDALFLEIQRVLKPNGVLVFNETIWLKSTSRDLAKRINESCKRSFGIIQSNDEFTYPDDWRRFLTDMGLEYQIEMPVSEIKGRQMKRVFSIPLLKSRAYTIIGKLRAKGSVSMRTEWSNYEDEIKNIMNGEGQLMEGIIVKAVNRKKAIS